MSAKLLYSDTISGVLNNIDIKFKKTQYIVLTPTHELAKQIYSVIENLGSSVEKERVYSDCHKEWV